MEIDCLVKLPETQIRSAVYDSLPDKYTGKSKISQDERGGVLAITLKIKDAEQIALGRSPNIFSYVPKVPAYTPS